MKRAFIFSALVFAPLLTSANAENAANLKVIRSSKISFAHGIIVSDIKWGQWAVCWDLGSDGTPLGKGSTFVKGKFVEIMIISQTHHDVIVDFSCEYERL